MASTGAVLAFGQVLRAVVDSGLSSGSAPALNRSLVFFLIVVTTMTVAGLARSYLLAWIGEQVVADIRTAVFGHVLGLDIGFFETTRTGEIISRLTADTALVQTMVMGGSSRKAAPQDAVAVTGTMIPVVWCLSFVGEG